MTPQNATLDSKRTLSWFVSYQRLSSQFQFSLSAVTLGYLSQCQTPWQTAIDTTEYSVIDTIGLYLRALQTCVLSNVRHVN
jgi:hypothetical protein